MSHGLNTNIVRLYISELFLEQLLAVNNRDLIKALNLGVREDQYIELITPSG